MGVVYEGVHTRIQRHVAIKILHEHLNAEAKLVQRFEREAQAAARIGSDHIVDVYDVGELESGAHYMVMELLHGESLSSFMKRNLSLSSLLAIVLELLEGLSEAHEAGIVHRDLKPANIFVVKGSKKRGPVVKILDFGVSKFHDLVGEGNTASGTLIGTPHYMAPEQVEARVVDGRADLYSLGVLLFRHMTGTFPFKARTMPELVAALLTRDAPPPRRWRRCIRRWLRSSTARFSATRTGAIRRRRHGRGGSRVQQARGDRDVRVPEPTKSRVGVVELQTPASGSLVGGAASEAPTVVTPSSGADLSRTEVMPTPEPSLLPLTPPPISQPTPIPISQPTPIPISGPMEITGANSLQLEQASLVSQTVSARRGSGRSSTTLVVVRGFSWRRWRRGLPLQRLRRQSRARGDDGAHGQPNE